MIKRYYPTLVYETRDSDEMVAIMSEEKDGEYVKWEDVKNLIEENEMHRKYDAECW